MIREWSGTQQYRKAEVDEVGKNARRRKKGMKGKEESLRKKLVMGSRSERWRIEKHL